MLTVFVTGGSGFVGGAVVEALADRGDSVRALVRTPAAATAVESTGALSVPGDLADHSALHDGVRGADLVIHCAAKLTGGSRERAWYRQVNVEGTRAVLAVARAAGVPRVVFVSTEQVILDRAPLVDADETWPYTTRPVGWYAATKLESERMVRQANSAGMQTVAVRPRMVWGPGDRGLLPGLVAAAGSGRLRWVDGGDYLTSTTHVRNAAEAILAAAERGRGGEAYFVSDGEPVRFREFVTALLASQGVPAPTGTVPRRLATAVATAATLALRVLPSNRQPPFDRATLRVIGETCTIRDDRARRELGYEGRVTRAEGLAELRSGTYVAGDPAT